MTNIKKYALALKPAQRIRLVQEIWDSIAAEPDNVEVPAEHIRLIEQRLCEHERDPEGVITLAELKRRVKRNLRRKRTK